MGALKQLVKAWAREQGFDLAGITSAEPFPEAEQIALERLSRGLMGELPWYTQARVKRGTRPQELLPGARSIISVMVSYLSVKSEESGPFLGRVARYAWGRDYHSVLKKRLKVFMKGLEECLGRPIRYRIYVDDGPIMDREVARRAGLGFFGKNTNILTRIGSWAVMGEVITDLELEPDQPLRSKSCGRCTLCMQACPTGAIIAPYVIDSNRCISYHTIENRGPIPWELRPLMGDWVFGCDICQEVCPVNRRAHPTREPAFQGRSGFTSIDLLEVLAMTEEDFQARFQGSPIRRARLAGLQRNACIALGNIGDARAVPALARVLREGEPLVRGHSAWALGRIGGSEAWAALETALTVEEDLWVREEIELALQELRKEVVSTGQRS